MAEGEAGYGKRPLWQWILIYIVIGGIIYAVIYYFISVFRGGNTSSDLNQNTQQTAPRNPIGY